MALMRRSSNQNSANIWPGFVDAMTALLLVLMFVLTIFMIVQFVLRETISGQDEELNSLSSQVAGLAEALGLENQRNAALEDKVGTLTSTLDQAENTAENQRLLIRSLSAQNENQQARIASFEEQVAGLLGQNRDLTSSLSTTRADLLALRGERDQLLSDNQDSAAENEILTRERARLLADKDALAAANLQVISEKEALQLALAQARGEIDQSVEEARLAAAKREALEALITDLQSNAETTEGSLSAALAALAQSEEDHSAARESVSRLEDTVSGLERDVESLTGKSEAQVLSEAELKARLDKLLADYSSSEQERLAEAAAAAALRNKLGNAEDELTAMTLALEAQRKAAENTLTLLAAEKTARSQLLQDQTRLLSEQEKQRVLLAQADALLENERQVSSTGLRKLALLNQQTSELRKQLNALQGLLDSAQEKDAQAQVQIDTLGANLNTALAQVAGEQKKRAELEKQERLRLEAEAKDLKKFKSEFFGQLRDVLGNREGVRIVGDRFVFSSEVLFTAGSDELGEEGKEQIAKVALIIKDIAGKIPEGIDWILRVDGHTDKLPLSGFGKFRDNWELSQARALSVVRFLINDMDLPENRLAANGFGEFQPIDPGDSPEALARNRRIELKFTEK